MLKVGIIGTGNAGNQVAAKAVSELKIQGIAINTSENDLGTIADSADLIKIAIGDSKGSGKNRAESKQFLKDDIVKILSDQSIKDMISSMDVVFVVGSAGGGTGSGINPMLSTILSQTFQSVNVIIIGILPQLSEALSTHANELEYLSELFNKVPDARYMIYDNDTVKGVGTREMMTSVNDSIVRDINIIRGAFNTPTQFNSIDEKDGLTLISSKGRIVVASLYDIKEKDLDSVTIDDLLIEQLKKNTHAEIERDLKVNRMGVICNLSDKLAKDFNTHVPGVQKFIGEPVEEFEHYVINSDRNYPNNVFLIITGLSKINDRIVKINERIDDINKKQAAFEQEDDVLDDDMISGINAKREYINHPGGKVDISRILDNF